jgi:hypothetical protein
MGINDNPLGVSGTTLSGLGDQNGALYQFLKQTSGGSSNAQRAIDLAGQLVPQYQEVNPWEVAFQYFAEMGRQASQPGATAFGAAVGSMQVPLDYLNAKKKEKRESDSARLQTALTLGPSLKPDNLPNIFKEPPTADPSGSAASEIAKLYDDLNTAKDEASKDAEAFLLANPLATTEEISAAAQNNPAFAEAQTLQEKINSLAAASGFNRELYSAESELRKEWRKLKDPFNDISAGHKKLIASLEAQTGVGDMSAIFAYMKMLDENSVVRESEFQSAQNTSGLYQSLLTKYNQLKAGNMLSPTQRTEFMNLANQFYKVTEQFIDKNRLDLGITVSTYPNLNPRSVFGGSEEAPNSFYSDAVVFRTARDSGFTMDELWREMTDDEKAEYLP